MGAEGARTHCVPYLSGKRTEHNLNTKVYLHRLDDANFPVHLFEHTLSSEFNEDRVFL